VTDKLLISIATTAYDEAPNLPLLHERIVRSLEPTGHPFEIVITDNGSSDGSLSVIEALRAKDPRVKYVSLSRNFGHQGGLLAALDHCQGEAVICMDADLQHPPEVIPEMIRRWQEGYNVVYTVKNEEGTSWLRRRANQLFYALVSYLSGIDLTGGQADFRLMDRASLDAMLSLRENNKFLRGLSKWVGFSQTAIVFDVAERHKGQSKFRFFHLWRFALDGLFSFSAIPIHVFAAVGAGISLLSLLYFLVVICVGIGVWFFGFDPGMLPPGWGTLAAGIFFLGGVQLIGIGLLGEYLARIFDEAKGRPPYIIWRKSLDSDPNNSNVRSRQ
jgi:polyisoprenyl-phosphate glycosyltransferase